MLRKILPDRREFRIQRYGEGKSVDDPLIAILNLRKRIVEIMAFLGESIAVIEHVRHFGVRAVALSGRRGYDEPAVRIGLDDIFNLHKLFGACKRASAEFDDLNHEKNLRKEVASHSIAYCPRKGKKNFINRRGIAHFTARGHTENAKGVYKKMAL